MIAAPEFRIPATHRITAVDSLRGTEYQGLLNISRLLFERKPLPVGYAAWSTGMLGEELPKLSIRDKAAVFHAFAK